MCVANVFHTSDSHSLSDESAVIDGSCKTSLTDIPLTWLLISKSHIRHRYPLSDGYVSIVSSGL